MAKRKIPVDVEEFPAVPIAVDTAGADSSTDADSSTATPAVEEATSVPGDAPPSPESNGIGQETSISAEEERYENGFPRP
jgi:hypothetical protein